MTRGRAPKFIQAELDFIKEHWPEDNNVQKINWIVRRLKFYTSAHVHKEAIKMGLGSGSSIKNARSHWTDEDDQILIRLRASGKTFEEIRKEMGRTRQACAARYSKLKSDGKIPPSIL